MLFQNLKKIPRQFPLLAKAIRFRFSPSDYLLSDKLYVAYSKADVDITTNKIDANAIRFPDFSCNWCRFSEPRDVLKRKRAKKTEGCYSFTVSVARFKERATTCHDPLCCMYAHTEIRQLNSSENVMAEPPKIRPLKSGEWSKSKRLEYRQNIINNYCIEFEAIA